MNTKQKHRKKAALFNEQEGMCFYCKKKMLLTRQDRNMPYNAATFEHLYCKGDLRRWCTNKNKERKVVLACYKCNSTRPNIYNDDKKEDCEIFDIRKLLLK